jgi:predicted small secreted protein
VKKKLLVLPLALLVAALGLAACGGSSSSSGGDEASIETAIEESATSEDPTICTEFQTEAFNEEEFPEGNALEECEEKAESGEASAESVDVSKIEVEGETATAEVAVTGQGLNGQTLELELAKEGGDWKLNSSLGFSKYDATAFGESVEEKLAEEEGISPELAACVGEALTEASQEEAEEMVFEKNTEPLEEMAQGCE